jgi:hypothetical protein
LYVVGWVGTAFSLLSLVLWCYLLKGNTVKRAATLDTTGHRKGKVEAAGSEKARTTSADSPVLDRGLVATPIRKRTISNWFRE